MTRVGGPPPGVVPSALPQGAPITAVLSDLPAALRNLTLGAFLTGTVLERNGSGITMLQTGAGVFGIKTTVPLPPGSTVTLQVQSAGAQMQAIVLSVTPQGASAKAPMPLPAQPATPVSAPPPAPPPITSNAQPAPAIVDRPVIASTAITATVIGPAGGPAPALPPAPAPTSAPPAPAGATAPNTGTGDAPAGSTAANAARPVPDAPTANAAQTAVYQRQMSIVSSASPAPPAPAPAGPPAPAPTPSPSAGAPQSPAAPVAPERAATASSPAPDKPLAPLPSGTQVQIRLLPSEPGAARPATPTAPTASATPATPTGPTPTSTAPVVRGVSSGVTPPPNAAPAPSGAQATTAHQTVAATIVARTPAGQTILDTPVGRILAALPRMVEKAAPGTRIQLELLTAERGTGTPRPTIAASGPSAIAREWPGLRDVLKLVQDAAAPEVRAALDRALPKPGPQLARQMLAFVDAATQGGVRTWLGEGIARIIERLGGGELVNRLDHDLRDMLATQRGDGDWRMTIIPLLDGRELRQIRFFERRRKRDEKERRREDSARFVVECEHSEFGALQIDGLMNEKRLDLILRSHDPLPQEMERDILALFGDACTGLGLNGQLFFQAVPVFPVSPLEDLSHNAVQVSI